MNHKVLNKNTKQDIIKMFIRTFSEKGISLTRYYSFVTNPKNIEMKFNDTINKALEYNADIISNRIKYLVIPETKVQVNSGRITVLFQKEYEHQIYNLLKDTSSIEIRKFKNEDETISITNKIDQLLAAGNQRGTADQFKNEQLTEENLKKCIPFTLLPEYHL